MNNLENKVIIITGGSKGIGRVTALRLAKQNARLVLASRKIDDLMKIKEELQLPDDRILLVEADVSNEEDCSSIVNQAVEKFGRVDVLINNAAQFNRSKVIDLDLNDFDRVWKTNVRGVIAMTQRVLPHMINQNEGTILNISSTSGKRGYVTGAAYAASKFALNGFTECLLREVRENNIRVLTISPSMVDKRVKNEDELKNSGKGVYMRAEDVADSILLCLNLPQRALIKDIEIWGTNP
ncbi:MAG: SDR family oxidoreductase [Ignavibacteria bacterium]